MPIDLPSAIRDALHAEDIDGEQLVHPTLREPERHRPTHRLFLTSAAVAVVAGIAVAVSMLVSGTQGTHRPAGANPLTGVVGYKWRVIGLDDAQGTMSVPASLQREIGFTSDGYVLGDDTVNALQANYHATRDGYSVHDAGGTLAGYAGDDVIRTRVIAAVDAMFLSAVPGARRTASAVVVTVLLHGNSLALRRLGTGLRLERAGVQPKYFANSPSPTATASDFHPTREPQASIARTLWRIAAGAAQANDAVIARAEAVHASSRAHAVAILMGDGVTGDQPVWAIQVQATKQFTCSTCRAPAGSSVHGRYILIIVDAKTLEGLDDGITQKPAGLAKLGTVLQLNP